MLAAENQTELPAAQSREDALASARDSFGEDTKWGLPLPDLRGSRWHISDGFCVSHDARGRSEVAIDQIDGRSGEHRETHQGRCHRGGSWQIQRIVLTQWRR